MECSSSSRWSWWCTKKINNQSSWGTRNLERFKDQLEVAIVRHSKFTSNAHLMMILLLYILMAAASPFDILVCIFQMLSLSQFFTPHGTGAQNALLIDRLIEWLTTAPMKSSCRARSRSPTSPVPLHVPRARSSPRLITRQRWQKEIKANMVRVCSKFWTSHVVGFYCGTKGYLLYYNRNFLFYLFFIRSAATQGKEDCDYSLRAAINLTICLVQTHTLAHGLWKHAKCLGSTIYGLTKGYLRRRCQKHSNLSSGKQKKQRFGATGS